MKNLIFIFLVVIIYHSISSLFVSDYDKQMQEVERIKQSTIEQKELNKSLIALNESLTFDRSFTSKKILVKVDSIQDSFAIAIDYNGEKANIRLIGCRIPILGLEGIEDEFYAKESNAEINKLVGKYIWILKDDVLKDKYGSYWVYAYDGNKMINAYLLENGFASFDTIEKGNNLYSDYLIHSGLLAYTNHIGIWSEKKGL